MIYSAKWPLLISILFATLSTALGYKLIHQVMLPTKAPSISIVVAANDVLPLTKLEKKDLALIQVSQEDAKKMSFFQQEKYLVGHVIVNRVDRGMPFRKGDLLDDKTTNPFQLPEGYRAITFSNPPTTGVGGYLKAGQYADIIWNYEEDGVKKAILALQNVKVLAVGPPTDVQTKTNADTNTITLMLRTTDTLKLSYMAENGNITFTLRPSPIEPILEKAPLITTQLFAN